MLARISRQAKRRWRATQSRPYGLLAACSARRNVPGRGMAVPLLTLETGNRRRPLEESRDERKPMIFLFQATSIVGILRSNTTTLWQRPNGIKRWKFPDVSFSEGPGELPRLEINTAWSTAEIYLHGAHITHFQKKDQPPVLFLRPVEPLQRGRSIRGGIPVIFPGSERGKGESAHGFAASSVGIARGSQASTGEGPLRLSLPDSPSASLFPKFTADYWITVGKTLTAQLVIANVSSDHDFTFEDCLHSYFHVRRHCRGFHHRFKGADDLDKRKTSPANRALRAHQNCAGNHRI